MVFSQYACRVEQNERADREGQIDLLGFHAARVEVGIGRDCFPYHGVHCIVGLTCVAQYWALVASGCTSDVVLETRSLASCYYSCVSDSDCGVGEGCFDVSRGGESVGACFPLLCPVD